MGFLCCSLFVVVQQRLLEADECGPASSHGRTGLFAPATSSASSRRRQGGQSGQRAGPWPWFVDEFPEDVADAAYLHGYGRAPSPCRAALSGAPPLLTAQ
jgi:hypothetical protein